MRTTITLDHDVFAAVDQLRRAEHIGVSEAVNRLARQGLQRPQDPTPVFRTETFPLGLRADVSSIADVLEEIEGPRHR